MNFFVNENNIARAPYIQKAMDPKLLMLDIGPWKLNNTAFEIDVTPIIYMLQAHNLYLPLTMIYVAGRAEVCVQLVRAWRQLTQLFVPIKFCWIQVYYIEKFQ